MRDAPADTIRQARGYLARLDAHASAADGQADLFAAAAPAPDDPARDRERALAERVAALDPDALSPREALEALYELKRLGGG